MQHDVARISSQPALAGIIAASLTPVDRDFAIDVFRFKAHIDWLFESGCSFVSLFGSTGEGPSFSMDQKRSALEHLARMGVPMARLVPAAMSCAIDETVETIHASAGHGCRAVLVVPPFYYESAGQNGIKRFFDACATRLGGFFPINIILYHIPALSRISYEVALVDELIERFKGQIVGIKDSTGDKDHTLMLARRFPSLSIFTGDERVLHPLLEQGGAGMIGGMPNIVAPDLCAFFKNPNGPNAQALMDRARRRIAAIDAYGGIPALRAIKAEMTGDPAWMRCVPPLEHLAQDRRTALNAVFSDTGFQFLTESD